MENCLCCNVEKTNNIFCTNCENPKRIHPEVKADLVSKIYKANKTHQKLIKAIINTDRYCREIHNLCLYKDVMDEAFNYALTTNLINEEELKEVLIIDPFKVLCLESPTLEQIKILLSWDLQQLTTFNKIPEDKQTALLKYCLENVDYTENEEEICCLVKNGNTLNLDSLILIRNYFLIKRPFSCSLYCWTGNNGDILEIIQAHKNFSLAGAILKEVSPTQD